MAAVAAAVVAAFLAGGIALYRERRLERRRLRVAARSLHATFAMAGAGVHTASEIDGWNVIDLTPGRESFEQTWAKHQDVLAGHLSRQDWNSIQSGVLSYLIELSTQRPEKSNQPPARDRLTALKATIDHACAVLRPLCE